MTFFKYILFLALISLTFAQTNVTLFQTISPDLDITGFGQVFSIYTDDVSEILHEDGDALESDGKTLAVGVPSYCPIPGSCGAVFIYYQSPEGTTWDLEKVIFAFDSQSNAFGSALDIEMSDNLILVVGDPTWNSNSGKIWVYQRDIYHNWTGIQIFYSDYQEPNSYFGISISMASRKILVGAPGENVTGVIYGWYIMSDLLSQKQKVFPNGPVKNFGASLVIGGNYAAATASINETTPGIYFLFYFLTGWRWTDQKTGNLKWGTNFALSTDGVALISDLTGKPGVVEIYQANSLYEWKSSYLLIDTPDPCPVNFQFGTYISITQTNALISASDRVYLYLRSGAQFTLINEIFINATETNRNLPNELLDEFGVVGVPAYGSGITFPFFINTFASATNTPSPIPSTSMTTNIGVIVVPIVIVVVIFPAVGYAIWYFSLQTSFEKLK